jgi:beta-1,4-mannosyltransferase
VSRPLIVLQSTPEPRPTTNPYIVMLREHLRTAGVQVVDFSWRNALFGRYDLVHLHWPETMPEGRNRFRALVREALTFVLVLRITIMRIPVVRTMHNVHLPDGLSRRVVVMLRILERLTTLRIRLNTSTETPPGTAVETILLGHFRDWFAAHPRSAAVPGRIGYFGLVRRYKGIETLIDAFLEAQQQRGGLSLTIAGKPSSDQLTTTLTERSAHDPAIELDLRFVSDAELVALATSCELIVMPYHFMHNSSGALTALSLDRPVLVPDNEVNRQLSADVGPGWVHRYTGALGGADLLEAIAAVQTTPPLQRPDLSARDWDRVGKAHEAAYRRAVSLKRSAGPWRRGDYR